MPPTGPSPEQPGQEAVSAPDITAEPTAPKSAEDTVAEVSTPLQRAQGEAIDHELPAAEPQVEVTKPEFAAAEFDRAAVIQSLDEVSSQLAKLREQFEGVASESPLKVPAEVPAVDQAVVQEAVAIDQASPAPTVADLVSEQPAISSLRLQANRPIIPADAPIETANNYAGAVEDAKQNTLGAQPRPQAGETFEVIGDPTTMIQPPESLKPVGETEAPVVPAAPAPEVAPPADA